MVRTPAGISVPFRYVAPGSFQIDQGGNNPNGKMITMTLTKGFWMAETPVSQELFYKVMGKNPSRFDGSPGREAAKGEKQDNRPVENVNWYAAIAFCNKLSLAEGKEPVYDVQGQSVDWAAIPFEMIPTFPITWWISVVMDKSKNGYRLPTEMEWMWAAMGADSQGWQKGYAGSAEGAGAGGKVHEFAWISANAGNKTHEMGKKKPNELGLYDMSGNVWEWCWDWIGPYPAGGARDYNGSQLRRVRVQRGGSYKNTASYCAAASRDSKAPQQQEDNTGFRIVCGAS
ncbi:MAG: formylglycine-generating enzyme family protein [Treponema sp.]|nr:formylglycine-generating enzyme family protein [Treponema sp.]